MADQYPNCGIMDTNNKSNVMFGVQDFTRPPPNFSNLPQHYPGFKTDNSNKDSMNWNPKDNFPVRLGILDYMKDGYGGNGYGQGGGGYDYNSGGRGGNSYGDGGNRGGDFERRGGSGAAGFSGSGNKGGYNKGGDGEMITQEDTIFVSGMNPDSDENDIANHFGQIGIIKKDKKTMKPKVWLYKNKETGLSKGEATVTYDDPNAAKSAISWFDGRDFQGAMIKVSLAQRQNNWNKGGRSFGGGRGGGGGGGSFGGGDRGARQGFDRDRNGGGGGGRPEGGRSGGPPRGGQGGGNNVQQRDGDWLCSSCNNTNFAWRNECNRCKTPKDSAGGGGGGMPDSGRGSGGDRYGGDRSGQSREYGGGPRNGGGGHMGGRGGGGFGGNRGGNGGNSFGGRRDGGPVRGQGGNDRGGNRQRPY